MKFDKKLYGIYMTSAVIVIGLIYMGISGYYVATEVMGKTSADLAREKLQDSR